MVVNHGYDTIYDRSDIVKILYFKNITTSRVNIKDDDLHDKKIYIYNVTNITSNK